MSLVRLLGRGILMPGVTTALSTSSSALLDATGEKLAFSGRFWHPSGLTKNISRIQFGFGTCISAGGSALTASLQNVSTAGPPMQPDETQDQTVAIPNSDFVSNTWYRTNALSANRSVAIGELLSFVLEFDGAGRLGSDSCRISIVSTGSVLSTLHQSVVAGKSGTWSRTSGLPNILFECDDGSFGTLDGGTAISSSGTLTSINTGSTPDEVALRFVAPFNMEIDGIFVTLNAVTDTADHDVILYDSGGSVLESVSVDSDQISIANTASTVIVPFAARALTKGQTYYVSVKPTTANSISIPYWDVNHIDHLNVFPQINMNCCWAQRTDAGVWSETTTRFPIAGIRVCSIDDGTVPISPGRIGGWF